MKASNMLQDCKRSPNFGWKQRQLPGKSEVPKQLLALKMQQCSGTSPILTQAPTLSQFSRKRPSTLVKVESTANVIERPSPTREKRSTNAFGILLLNALVASAVLLPSTSSYTSVFESRTRRWRGKLITAEPDKSPINPNPAAEVASIILSDIVGIGCSLGSSPKVYGSCRR